MSHKLIGFNPAKGGFYETPISDAEHQALQKQWRENFDPVTCENRYFQRLRERQASKSGKSASASSPSTTKTGAS